MAQELELTDVLSALRHDIVNELHTTMPGSILHYDPVTQLADVQPLIKKFFWENSVVNDVLTVRKAYVSYPAISRVPVIFPGGSGFAVTWPLGQGDTVQIEFSEASLTEYLTTGQESSPVDISRHKLGHCVVRAVDVPLPRPSTDPTTTGNVAMMIGQKSGVQITIDPSGGVTIDSAPGITLGKGATDSPSLALATDANFQKVIAGLTAMAASLTAAGSAPVVSAALGTLLTTLIGTLTFAPTKSLLVKSK